MTMMRFRRVAQLWNWLPGFRGVAEHQSIHKAAQTLAVSASALSRTVRLLESALGAELFVRHADGLELTMLGNELLAITRDAMRQVDEGITREELRRGGLGSVYVGTTSELTTAIVARALPPVATAAEGGVFHITRVSPEAIDDELLQGNLDLVITEQPSSSPSLRHEPIGHARYGLYAARPSSDERRPLAALIDGPNPSDDDQANVVAAWCESVAMIRTLCEQAPLIGVLPDVAVREAALHRLGDLGEPIAIHAVRRAALPHPDANARIASLLERVRSVVA